MLRITNEALAFISEQIYIAQESAEAPALAGLLAARKWDSPFAFVSADNAAISWRHGGLHDKQGASARMVSWVKSWLATPDPEQIRLLVLEESIWTVGQKLAEQSNASAGPTPFYLRTALSTEFEIEDAFHQQSSSPGDGVLASLPGEKPPSAQLQDADLKTIAASAHVVMVSAWDDEAVLFAAARLS